MSLRHTQEKRQEIIPLTPLRLSVVGAGVPPAEGILNRRRSLDLLLTPPLRPPLNLS